MDGDELDEELLPQPPRHDWPRSTRLTRLLLALVGAAAVIAGAVHVLHDGHRTARADATPTPAPTATPTPVAAPRGITTYPTGRRALTVDDSGRLVAEPTVTGLLATCPVRESCESDDVLPDAVQAGVLAHFPGASVADTRTIVARESPSLTVLVGRVIEAHTATLAIVIEIRRPVPGDAAGATVDTSRERIDGTARALTAGFTVTAAVAGDAEDDISLDALRTLVQDRRLLVRPAADRNQSDDQGQR